MLPVHNRPLPPASVGDWLALVKRNEESAALLAQDRKLAAEGFYNAGFAVECALKAYIYKKEGFNRWPSKDSRPDVWTHDLRELVKIAGITIDSTDPLAPAWHVVFSWNRSYGYSPKRMPRRVAQSMVDAAFGPDGVVTWIRQKLS